MKLNLPKTTLNITDNIIERVGGIKKCTNHFKSPSVSKNGKRVTRGYTSKGVAQINEFHAKRMAADKALRASLEAAK